MVEHISGAMVRSHIAALQTRVGPALYDQLFNQLGREDQEDLRLVTPLSWVRIDALERLYTLLAPSQKLSVAELHTQIASQVVGQAVTTIWRALLRLTSDNLLVSKTPVIFKRAYQQGSAKVIKSQPREAEIEVQDWPEMSEFALRGLRVGIESTLRAAGRSNPRGVGRRTREGAIIRLEWDR